MPLWVIPQNKYSIDGEIDDMNKFEKINYFQYNGGQEILLDSKAEYDCLKLPKRATKHSAGYDFFSPIDFTLSPNETIIIPTGIKVQLDEDKYLAIYPRSSLGIRYRLQLDNTVGIIDSDYYNNKDNEGHIFIKFTNLGDKTLRIKQGEAIAQGIISQYFTVSDDDCMEMRMGGIGSTNK